MSMRIVGICISTLGVMALALEIYTGKIFISTVLLSILLILLGTFTYVKNVKLKFPKFDDSGKKRASIMEDIPLVVTDDLDHLDSIQHNIKKMKKDNELMLKLVTLQGKENHVKVTNLNGETLGVVPYTYPNRKFLAYSLEEDATVLAKVFKTGLGITGKRKIFITIAIYSVS